MLSCTSKFQIENLNCDNDCLFHKLTQKLHRHKCSFDTNHDDKISYEEFAPVAFGLCVSILERQMSNGNLPEEEAEIRNYLQQLFESADASSSGKLSFDELFDLLSQSDLGFCKFPSKLKRFERPSGRP